MIVLGAAAVIAGCGSAPSADNPPAAGPAFSRPVAVDEGSGVAVVHGRDRTLVVRRDAGRPESAPAGVGPSNAVSDGHSLVFVVDTAGDGLLLFRTRPHLELRRRVYLPGRPLAIAYDPRRGRLWIALTARNGLAEVTANGRPRVVRTLPTVAHPDAVRVDPRSGVVVVRGRDGHVQRVLPAPAP